MILFCDTSALVKLYIKEDASEQMAALARSATAIVLCRIAWAEIMAALARRARENPADAAAIEAVRTRLRTDWPRYAIVEITQPLLELAGEYADTFALRSYDSVQLAAARRVQESVSEQLHFACFDTRLQKAARALGMTTSD
ncbi:type II toxin-antitoxin system VapC family toxin [Accumulibacter sp.]|uniref:Ribonuclease VapC n=1 Tax=Candidatus Accumulibacter proximus TaxID=2954385 RepID=A0A935UHP1_9PROT|nr:type II toxin-antitoxin system VapC family toxin [Accumulibacter sp.]MBK7675939.1 type II toxin-antitoxin system VapC family toxin [Candidatus Accumulibacter proximus]MBL8373733.1 type II toxin-antitoxin system VapC family toxin [Accumulibacter sp.]